VAARYFGEVIQADGNDGAVFGAQHAATVDSFPKCLQQCCRAQLVRGVGGVEGFLKIGNTSLGIGHANRAHDAWSAAVAYTLFFWCLAVFLFHTLCTKGIDFFEGALMCDEFSTQFPRGATLFELLGVLVYHQEMLHA